MNSLILLAIALIGGYLIYMMFTQPRSILVIFKFMGVIVYSILYGIFRIIMAIFNAISRLSRLFIKK